MDNIVFFFFKFYLYFIFLYFLGRSFLILISKLSKIKIDSFTKIQGLEIQIFYPVVGIFFLGNYLYLLNYLVPISHPAAYLSLLFLIVNIYEPLNRNATKNVLITLPFYAIILISSFDINFHYDAGLYHLNNQLWIRESNIVFGLSNIYGPFGVGSIYEYISSFLWVDKTFMLIHFTNIIFVGLLYSFIFINLTRNKNHQLYTGSFLLLLYSIFDNFGLTGGRNGFINIQSIGKQDLPIAVLFLVTSILLLTSIFRKRYKEEEFLIYSILALFIFQLKISGVVISFFYILFLYYYKTEKNITIFKLLSKIKFLIILSLFWLTKSLLQTGCVIFPLESSCITGLSWVNSDYLLNIENVTVNFSNSYYFGESLKIWIETYLEVPTNQTILYNYFMSLFTLFIITKIFFINYKNFKKQKILLIIFSASCLFYLRFGPDMRYLSGLMMLGVYSIGINHYPRKNIPIFLVKILLLSSLIMVPKLDSYKSFSLSNVPRVLLPEEKMIERHGRLAPSSGDQCWVNINCSANFENYNIDNSGYFKIVTLKK
jgi:hypothetical protein